MPVILQPGKELVMDEQVLFHPDPKIKSKSGKFFEERLCSSQQFDQNLHELCPPCTRQFHHQGRCVKDAILRLFMRLQND
jgi:hypothetical protein